MITKEQCEQALRNLETINLDIVLAELGYEKAEMVSWYGMNDYPTLEKQCDIDVLRELIEEHFDNPPLKFEEIRPDDWVWDKKNKEWRQVNFAGVVGKDDELMFYEDVFKKGVKIVAFKNFRSVVFEENRFYRKEVQE